MKLPSIDDTLTVCGAITVSTGLGFVHWQSGVMLFGALMLAGGVLLARNGGSE